MSKYLDENGLLYLWEKITDAIDPKADKVPEVNHGTSDTTFTLTPNIMHIWGEIATLNLTLSADSNSVLDEYMFTFTCPSDAATNLTLPSSIKWILQPELLAGKTYLVSIVNGLAGYLTDDMPMTGDENIIEEITVNGTTVPVVDKVATITGTVSSVTVNGSNYTPDANGLVNLGTISGGEGGTGGEYNVIEGVTFNGTTAPITNKIAAITYTAPTLSKGTTTGSGNAVTDISVSGHTITLTKGTTFLTSYTETDPTVPAAVKAITATDISNWNNKQAALVSGTNIKTINGNSILGEGNISISGASGGEANVIESVKVNGTALTVTNKAVDITAVPASIVTQDATHRFVSDTEKSTWNSKSSTDTKNTAGATATTVTGSNKFYLVGAPEQTANPTTNTINYFYVDASGLNIPTDINALQKTATLGKIILPGTGGGILADGTGGVQSTTKVWNTFGSYTDISGFATDSNVVHKSGEETITGDKTFSGQVSFESGNSVYFEGDNMVRGDVFITNNNSGATNVQITTDNNNDNRVVVKASETGFSWIQASNGTLDLLSVLDAKEVTSNKVTSISSSSTNTQYPSALAVYNFGTNLVSQLATIYSGSGAPSSSLGNNGDIYIKVT